MTPTEIIRNVSRITKVPTDIIASSRREPGTGDARALVAWALKQVDPSIGYRQIEPIMKITQSSVFRALERAENLYDTCPKFRRMRDEIGRLIKAREVAA